MEPNKLKPPRSVDNSFGMSPCLAAIYTGWQADAWWGGEPS